MAITVNKLGYAEFKRLLAERYGKYWIEWVYGLCPDGLINEERILEADLDEMARKLGWPVKNNKKQHEKYIRK